MKNRNQRLERLEERIGVKNSLPPFISLTESHAAIVSNPHADQQERIEILQGYGVESFRELSRVKVYVGISPDDWID